MMRDQRQVYGQTLVRLGSKNERIVVLDADLSKSTMGCMFKEAYPHRHFEMGIAEQNMVSFGAGLALLDRIPVMSTFAVFMTGRAYDQIRQGICIAGLNVKIAGSSAGLSDFGDGATHQAIEDIALMRALPNMTVLVPADGIQTERMLEWMVDHDGPVYIRVNRNPVPDIYDDDYRFDITRTEVLNPGDDLVIFACGVMVKKALDAAKLLADEGISALVVNVPVLKPFNGCEIRKHIRGHKSIVTVEEHSVTGGLGDAVCASVCGLGIPVKKIGINDCFGQSARDYDKLLDHYGLNTDTIIKASIGRSKGDDVI